MRHSPLKKCPSILGAAGFSAVWPLPFQIALQDLQTNSKIAALLPYFVYVVSGVSGQPGAGDNACGEEMTQEPSRLGQVPSEQQATACTLVSP